MPVNPYYSGPESDHFDGTRFFNPGHPTTDRGIPDLLRWRMTGKRQPWPASVPGHQVVPEAQVDGLTVTMVGHATVLIQIAGQNILVDPVWSERVSPVNWAGPRRVTQPGIAFDTLPRIDVVLITHNHYDHLDINTLRRLWHSHHPRFIAPLGNDRVVLKSGLPISIETGDWGDTIDVSADFSVVFHPAYHWSARGVNDKRMALWCGFVVKTLAGTVYIAGDTGYGDGKIFQDIKHNYPSLDLAILPIGAYAPRWFMKDQHINPEEALQIMLDCGAKQALGAHWGTFQLTDEAMSEPKEQLLAALLHRNIDSALFLAMEAGDVWNG